MRKYILTVLAAAFVIACSPNQKINPEIPDDSSHGTPSTETTTPPSVTTGDAEEIGNHDALIVSKFADAPIRGAGNRGVRYGLSPDNLDKETTLGKTTSRKGSFNVRLTALARATTYYYQAFITVWDAGAGQDVDIPGAVKQFTTTDTAEPDPQPDDPDPDEPDPQPGISVTVNTGAASSITSSSANITCNYSGAPSVGVYERGIYYGTSSSAMNSQATLDSSTATSGYFTVVLSSLSDNTTYYYKAYVTVWDASQNRYVDVSGSVRSFTTMGGGQAVTGLQYLGGYEIPAISLQNKSACSGSGADSDGPWFNYNTTDSNQKIVTHAYTYSGKQYRNWTALVDKTKKAALWNAFVMHDDAYPDNDAGRNDSWRNDPAIPSDWQQGGISGYSRGHMVASNYRQTCKTANRQTFYHTNQAPQFQTQFNDGVWNNLEQAVKSHAPSGRDTLYVVVGVLYENNKTVSGVPVPSHFYKLLMKCSFNTSGAMTAAKGCAYIFTNEAHPGMNYSQGLTSIDAIEQRSGFDFFHNIPQSLQDAAEKTSSGLW